MNQNLKNILDFRFPDFIINMFLDSLELILRIQEPFKDKIGWV